MNIHTLVSSAILVIVFSYLHYLRVLSYRLVGLELGFYAQHTAHHLVVFAQCARRCLYAVQLFQCHSRTCIGQRVYSVQHTRRRRIMTGT